VHVRVSQWLQIFQRGTPIRAAHAQTAQARAPSRAPPAAAHAPLPGYSSLSMEILPRSEHAPTKMIITPLIAAVNVNARQ
jgi:hypothetical protein